MVEIYIVKNDGILLYYNNSDKKVAREVENATLFSGIISAIKSFLKELEIGEVQTFSTDENTIFILSRKNLAYVFVIKKEAKIDEKTVFEILTEYSEKVCELINENIEKVSWDDNLFSEVDEVTSLFLKKIDDLINESQVSKKLMDMLW